MGIVRQALAALVRAVDNTGTLGMLRSGQVLLRARRVLAEPEEAEPPWTPFEAAQPLSVTDAQIAMIQRHFPAITEAEAHAVMAEERRTTQLWVNSRYQVGVRMFHGPWGPMAHLSAKRIDQAAIHDWRDLQRIKNELIGERCEAIELYPDEERLVDGANQFHLWAVRDPAFRFPIGFQHRAVAGPDEGPAGQRPR